MTPQERAALDQALASAWEFVNARKRLDAACAKAAVSIDSLGAAFTEYEQTEFVRILAGYGETADRDEE